MEKKNFWREAFSENGVGSSKRVLGSLMLVTCMVFMGFLVIKEGGTDVVENIMQTTLIVGSSLLGLSSITSIWKGNKVSAGNKKDEHEEIE